MYGNRKITDHPKKAGEFSSQALADAKTAGSRFEAARKAFVKAGKLSDSKLAAIGYCFGGSVVIEMARQGRNLAGVVSFHGGLVTPSKAKKGKIKAKLLVLNGASDKMITAAHISDFKKEMKSAGADFEFISYQGALHGFTNPEATANGKRLGFPLAYNKDADLKSWNKMSGFLKTIF
jgi:dienelactone hydrolase